MYFGWSYEQSQGPISMSFIVTPPSPQTRFHGVVDATIEGIVGNTYTFTTTQPMAVAIQLFVARKSTSHFPTFCLSVLSIGYSQSVIYWTVN